MNSKRKQMWALTAVALTAATTLNACTVNCDSEELIGYYESGYDSGLKQIDRDERDGAAAGQALTYAQGCEDGRRQGYQEGYTQGYNSPDGYSRGSTDGFNDGIADGANSTVAFSEGAADGYNDGRYDGRPVGEHDGYGDGYEDGYFGAFPAGQNACIRGSEPSDKNKNTCEGRGYTAAYDDYLARNGSRPYDRAFAIAKAANAAYQTGLAGGRAAGVEEGRGPGMLDGYRDGYNAGYSNGLIQGREIIYQNAYSAAYPDGYTDGYNEGYLDPYTGYGTAPFGGSYSNGTGGYGDGYEDGFYDGYMSLCESSPGDGQPLMAEGVATRRYGKDQVWARDIGTSKRVDVFVFKIRKSLDAANTVKLTEMRVLHTLQELEKGIARSLRDDLRQSLQTQLK